MDLQGSLTGKTAIVTGGGRDIGRACVMALAEAGAKVAINYHSSAEGAESAVAEIEAAGGEAFAMKGDMTSDADVAALVGAARERFDDAIHALCHVTGGLVARKKISEMDVAHWNHMFDLNTTSFFRMVKACEPHMAEGSSIVSIASQAARDGGGPGAVAYAASKGAMLSMTRGLAKEFGTRIRVNTITPGMIDTDFHNIFSKPEGREKAKGATALKREGTSEEVADLVAFLSSERASFMTGNCIDINGGLAFS